MQPLKNVCDVLVNKQCKCLVGRHWLVLIAATSYAQDTLHTTACCAIAAVHDLVQCCNTSPTPALVLKILCANYVKQQMRRFFSSRIRRDRSRSPLRACERLCERLCDRELDSSPDLHAGLPQFDSILNTSDDVPKVDHVESLEAPLEHEELVMEPAVEPVIEPGGEPTESIEQPPEPIESVEEPTQDFIPLATTKNDEVPSLVADQGPQVSDPSGSELLTLMARVVRFFNMDDPDDGEGWAQHAERYPELQNMVIAYRQWRRVRETLCATAEEALVREFEVAVAALVSFIDCSIHDEDEEEEEDEEDEEDEEADDVSDAYELCCDTSSDDEETKEVEQACVQDPCYQYLHTLGAQVTPATYKHLTRFRTAFADQSDINSVSLRDLCLAMLQNLDCACLDDEPMLHAWVDATIHALIHMGSDKCDVIVASRSFFTLERRWPTMTELQEYVGRQRMQSGDPDRFYREERFAVPTPNLHRLLATSAECDSDCAICGHAVLTGTSCYVLSCGHQFHAVDCLESDSILNWLSTNKRCPVCRVEVAL